MMYRRSIKLAAMSGVVIVLTSVLLLPASARVAHTTSNHTSRSPQGPIDPADLEFFLDEFFAQNMEELNIPGAAIVVVEDGEILLSKGYGFADLEEQIPVDPAQTIMRVGSTSKLFTATAAMQLVEQGLLDLDADVNQYLTRVQLPDDPSGPVTLRQLLTHTAGFEDSVIGIYTHDPDAYLPLEEHLASNLPERVLEPGTVHSYSNYSFALVGQLIEDVSRLSFAQYVAEKILQPLGMARSTFEQPLPPGLSEDLAVGYFATDGAYEPGGFVFDQEPPAGALSSTAEDMARFMIAHLQDGRYEDVQILGEDVAQQMHAQQFTHHPDLPGMGYAFKERFVNGERLIGHGGDIGTYSSQMILHPEDDLGFFVVYNVFNDTLRNRLIVAFMDRYYEEESPATAPETLEMSQEELSHYAGAYRWVRHSRSTIGKLAALFPGPVNVNIVANEDSTLSVFFVGAESEWRYAPITSLVFKQVQGGVHEISGLEIDLGETLVFREDGTGEVEFAFVPLQNVALEKVAWYEGGEVQAGSLGLFLFIFFSPFVVWPLGALIRRIRKQASTATTGSSRARWVAGIVSVFNFIFLLILLFMVGDPTFGVPPIIRIALIIPLVTLLLTLIMLPMTVYAWKDGYWSVLGRIYYSFLTLTAVLFLVWANYWNLIGWRF
jgi:CubicO group peptidase (beta-lactamase class C family)